MTTISSGSVQASILSSGSFATTVNIHPTTNPAQNAFGGFDKSGIFIDANNVTITNSHTIQSYVNKYYYTGGGIYGFGNNISIFNSGLLTGYSGGIEFTDPNAGLTSASSFYINNSGTIGLATAGLSNYTDHGIAAVAVFAGKGSATIINSGTILGHTLTE